MNSAFLFPRNIVLALECSHITVTKRNLIAVKYYGSYLFTKYAQSREFRESVNEIRVDHFNLSMLKIEDDQYVNDHGDVVCKKCGYHIMTRISGDVRDGSFVLTLCHCQEEERKRLEEHSRAADNAAHAMALRDDCFYSDSFKGYTFSIDDGTTPEIMAASRKFIARFDDYFFPKHKGLLFHGPFGTGKTFTAACIANEMIDNGHKVKFTSFSRLINSLMGTFDGKQNIVDSLAQYDLVVIDDLGTERSTETVADYVFQIVDSLYQNGIPTIYTTNLKLDQIKEPQNNAQGRIYDRILERCYPVAFMGKNRRRKNIVNDYEETKEILGL